VLLLSAVAVSRVALGLVLLVAFSAGLAAVLMVIGVVALYARQMLGNSDKAAHSPFLRYVPVFSAAVILGVGLLMTGVAAGIVRPGFFVG
jgi:ABC-type nickel/cobalt efflux system permease component RcnA